MASSSAATPTTTHFIPYPPITLLPPAIQQDASYTKKNEIHINSIDTILREAKGWRTNTNKQGKKFTYSAWSLHLRAMRNDIPKSIRNWIKCVEALDKNANIFISALKEIEVMAIAELDIEDLQTRLLFHSVTGHQLSNSSIMDSASKLLTSYNSLQQTIGKHFGDRCDKFMTKTGIDKSDANGLQTFIKKLVLESLKTRYMKGVLQKWQLVTNLYLEDLSLETTRKLESMLNDEVEKMNTSGDQGDASMLNNVKPELPIVGLINDCKWYGEKWTVLIDFEAEFGRQKGTDKMNETFKSISFKDNKAMREGRGNKRANEDDDGSASGSRKRR